MTADQATSPRPPLYRFQRVAARAPDFQQSGQKNERRGIVHTPAALVGSSGEMTLLPLWWVAQLVVDLYFKTGAILQCPRPVGRISRDPRGKLPTSELPGRPDDGSEPSSLPTGVDACRGVRQVLDFGRNPAQFLRPS